MSVDVSGLLPGVPGAFHRFCKHLVGWIPHGKQEAFGQSTAKVLLLICGIRFGKSDVLALRYLHHMAFGPEQGRYLNAGPSQDQANIVVERAHALAMRGPLSGLVESYRRHPHPQLTFRNGSSLQGRSTDDVDLLRGRPYHGIGVDEAALAKQEDIDVLRGRLMDYAGWLALVTSPKGKDWLFQTYVNAEGRQANGDPAYFAATGTTWDNPIIPRAEIERLREDSEDRWYKQEIMGEFVDLEGATFPREVLDRIFVANLPCEAEPLKGGIYCAGWDVGRKTTLSVGTVLEASGDRMRGVDQIRLSGAPWTVIEEAINAQHRRWNAHTIIDGTGVGDPVEGHVEVPVTPFIFTAKSRANLITETQATCHRGEIILPRAWTHLYSSMLVHTWKEEAEGQTWDELDSLMLAIHHAREITFKGPLLFRLS